MWSALAVLSLAMAAGGITARLEAGPRFDWLLLMTAIGLTAAVAMRLLADNSAEREAARPIRGRSLKDLLDSAGTDDRFHRSRWSADLCQSDRRAAAWISTLPNWSTNRELSESARARRRRASDCGNAEASAESSTATRSRSASRQAAFAEIVRSLPPSQVPTFETHLRRRNGELFPVRLAYLGIARPGWRADRDWSLWPWTRAATMRKDQWKREARERYRDVFENSSEMIATLDLTGQVSLRQSRRGNDASARPQSGDDGSSSSKSFQPDCRAEAAFVVRRVLDGETIDRAPIRNETADGQLQELELSLHQRRRAGKPMAVQCLMRDVTQQKQREHRLALQLLVSQIVGENVSSEMAAMRVLEALCVSQGWDVAVKWEVNSEENRLEFSTAWGVPGKEAEALIQESMGMTLAPGGSLPGRAWSEGRLVWIADLAQGERRSAREGRDAAQDGFGLGDAGAGGQQGAGGARVLLSLRLREDRETTAAMETVAASLGQMLARTHERERAEELSRQQEILLDSVADGICGVDRHGLVSFANPAAARLLGAPVASLIGKPVHELLHGSAPDSKKCGDDCPLLQRRDRPRAIDRRRHHLSRQRRRFPGRVLPHSDSRQGRYSGSVLSFRDISQRYALDRLKDEFISTVSHELRTPLTSIRGALGLLSSGILGRHQRQGGEPAAHRAHQLRPPGAADQRHSRPGARPERTRAARLPSRADGRLVRQAIDGMQPVAEAAGVH